MDEEIEQCSQYKRFKSGYYWLDESHIGRIVVSQKMVDKYKLSARAIEDFFENNIFEDDFKHEYVAKFSHVIHIYHSNGYSRSRERTRTTKTPHGKCFSIEFVAWWNNFPLDLLYEGNANAEVWDWYRAKI